MRRVLLLQNETILLQSGTGITKWNNLIKKWCGYYKVGQLLQSGPSVNMSKSTEKQRNPYSKNLFFVICSVLI